MKLILHIGSGKTGTSSLQGFLARNSSKFEKSDVLYPVSKTFGINHFMLLAGFVEEPHLQIQSKMSHGRNYKSFKRDFDEFWAAFLKDIERTRPKVVILSAEQLFQDFSNKTTRSLKDMFGSMFNQIEVVVYLRSPVSDYASRVSQKLSRGRKMLPLVLRDIKAVLEYYEYDFPGKVHVNAYEKSQLINGNIIHDFVEKYVPNLIESLINIGSKMNVSRSFELLAELQKQRIEVQPHGELPEIKTLAFLEELERNYKRLPLSRRNTQGIILKPSVALYLTNMATDYLWLKEKHGVSFSDFDYANIKGKPERKIIVNALSDISIQIYDGTKLDTIVPSKSKLMSIYRTSLLKVRMKLKRLVLTLFSYSAVHWLKK